jgi:hypothetical protein
MFREIIVAGCVLLSIHQVGLSAEPKSSETKVQSTLLAIKPSPVPTKNAESVASEPSISSDASRKEATAKRSTSKKATELVEKNPKLVRSLIESIAAYTCITDDGFFLDPEQSRWTIHYAALTNLGSAAVPELLKAVRDSDPKIATAALTALMFDYGHYADFPAEHVLASLIQASETESNRARSNILLMVSVMIVQDIEGAMTREASGDEVSVEANKVLLSALRVLQTNSENIPEIQRPGSSTPNKDQ